MDPIPPNLSFLFHQIYKSAESDNCEHEVLAEDMKRKLNILLRLTYNNKIFHTIILSIFRKNISVKFKKKLSTYSTSLSPGSEKMNMKVIIAINLLRAHRVSTMAFFKVGADN